MSGARGTTLRPSDTGTLLMQRTLAGRELALPGAEDIYLYSCWIAGTRCHEAWRVVDTLREGDALRLQREPENPEDRLAIAVFAPCGARLGYVPRADNAVLARLMDAGKYLKGVTRRTARSPSGLPGIRLRVYMQNL